VKLPKAEQAVVAREKLENYLLSRTHPVGRFKAEFFSALGYTRNDWRALEMSIRWLLSAEAREREQTVYGKKYEVAGVIAGPNGRSARIVTVWIVRRNEDFPRFITAYPGEPE